MMLVGAERLARSGIVRYEVANYAAPGHEARHNTAYWTGRAYIGCGPGAHGMLTGTSGEIETLTRDQALREDVMLGMRLAEGVEARVVARARLESVFADLARDGLVESADGFWRTTTRGWLLGNEVFGRIWNRE